MAVNDRPGVVRLFVLFFVLSQLVFSCGRKGPPTLKSFEKPLPVSDVRAVHREDSLIISWSYPDEGREKIKGFYIEKTEGNWGEAKNAQNFKSIAFLKKDASQFADKDFATRDYYFYKIRAVSLRNIPSDDSSIVRVYPRDPPPVPGNLRYRVMNDSLEIKWDSTVPQEVQNDYQVRYNIYRTYQEGEDAASPLNNHPLKDAFFNDKLETKRSAYYTVRSLWDTDIKDEGYPSDQLEVHPDSFTPSTPAGLHFVSSGKEVYLIWHENPETWVSGYKIYRRRGLESGFEPIGDAEAPAFRDKNPVRIKTFYFITARGPKQQSPPSAVIEVNPDREE
ncbi:MAG: fibronectin type III domain-containing protein [Dissulfurispiraceae bacterium]